MIEFLQVVIDGLRAGSVYAALALALVLVYRTTHVVNLAQGEMATLSAFVAWQLTAWGVPLWIAVPAGVVFGALLGAATERVAIRPFMGRNPITMIMVCLALLIGFNSLMGWLWAYSPRDFPDLLPTDVLMLGGLRVPLDAVLTLVVVLAIVGLVSLFFAKTRIGTRMRAVVDNAASAQLHGIDVGRMYTLGWALAGAVGAVAAVLVAPRLFLEPNMMLGVLLFAFAAATAGGLTSPLGAVVCGLLIGVLETVAGTFIPWIGADLKIVVPLAILFVVLLVKPTGIFGRREVARV